MSDHTYQLKASWEGGLNGNGHFESGTLSHQVSAPKDMGGPGIGTNPEELILAASANCYLITFAAIAQFQSLHYQSLKLESSATFKMSATGPTLESIKHYITVVAPDKSQQATVEKCIRNAEQGCMIASAMKNNVHVMSDGTVTTAEPHPA